MAVNAGFTDRILPAVSVTTMPSSACSTAAMKAACSIALSARFKLYLPGCMADEENA
jgi:hypothetical protein